MKVHERQIRILDELAAHKKVHTNELADLLVVSRETIRRDLLDLEECGSVTRIHGGAVLPKHAIIPEPRFSDRLETHAAGKHDIGRVASTLVEPGSTLYIDAGTTTLAFARVLADLQISLRIITNSIEIAQLVARSEQFEVLLLGGVPHMDVPATYGELTFSEIDRFLADSAVISPVAYHSVRGASDYELHEAEVARQMIRRSKSCIMLCNKDKIEQQSRVTICRPEEIDHLVTDADADAAITLPRGTVHFA
ncbi:DeoR/GlpR family DNA-binding transcription regulator [Roseovarius sp. CAU 1744]|uniref:DeoR/GlpR family DNA-binding transcription regulator n=1 Tax=Roseovarius sp. CAU 1744 TaxID=3140368 RepID=UPI00325B4EF8